MRAVVVDVDLTLVDTLTPWITWWENKSGKTFDWDAISPEFSINKQLATTMTRDESLAYWRSADLYDNLVPHCGSASVLRLLKSMGYDIFFVSKCEDGHVASKQRFLDKFFPFHDGLINTHRKADIEAEIYFEDFNGYVQDIVDARPNAKTYQFVTKDNEYQLNPKATPLHNWREFAKLHFGA